MILLRRDDARSPSTMSVDIANAVSFLMGKDGGWVNSQVVRVNGGFA